MNLFNQRIISKAIVGAGEIPSDHLETLSNWPDAIKGRSEVAVQGDFKARIIENILGYQGATGSSNQTVDAEHQMGTGRVDLALGHFDDDDNNIVIAPFELKGADTVNLNAPMPGRNISPVQQAWNYANAATGVKWVLVSNYVEIRLYNYAQGNQEFELFRLKDLIHPQQYARFQLLLSAENLLGGASEQLLLASLNADKEISEKLYSDYKEIRQNLIVAIDDHNPDINPVTAVGSAQTILDRVLFIAFSEDTRLLPDNSLRRAFEHADPYNPKPVWENFRGLFRAIDQGNATLNIPKYNGGLFAFDPAVDDIQLPDEVCEGFKQLGDYDFETEISVTILGRIFEQSVSDLERLLARARGEEEEEAKSSGTTGRRKRDGIVYTPDYVARFIAERTLGTHVGEIFRTIMQRHAKGDAADYESLKFSKGGKRGDKKWKERELAAWTEYRLNLQTLRVVDPACGSGVFLVIAFDWLKAEYDKVNAKMEELRGSPDLFDPDAEILSQNLYGVDVNAESVEITKLSLWLKTARKGKQLASLDHTIRVGDSLIEDSNFAYLDHGFTWERAFPEVFAPGGPKSGFDVVLGNPPYVRQEFLAPLKPYLQSRFEVYHGVADLYCYFFERGLRLLKQGGRMGYISSSTFFKTNSGKPLREYLPQNAVVETITDFGDLQIFEGVTTYPAILTMRKGTPANDHQLRFWKLKTLPRDNFSKNFDEAAEDFPQSALTGSSWELESPALRALRQKIIRGKPTLKEVYGSPLYGIKTGRNEAFVIDRKTRDALVAEDPKSTEILKPWLEGKDLKRWRAEPRDLSIILFPKGWTKKNINTNSELEAWEWLQKKYPAIANWLEPFVDVCRKRTDKGDFWWELRACDYYNVFEKSKIAYNDISSSPSFYMDDKKYFFANTIYMLIGNFVTISILNSNAFWFYYTGLSPSIRGGFFRMFSQYINTIPIPPASDAQKATLAALAETCQNTAEARYAKQLNFRRRIGVLCPSDNDKIKRDSDGAPKLPNKLKNWWQLENFAEFRKEIKKAFKADIPLSERSEWEDWFNRDKAEIARMSGEITRCENEINQIVYQLFDLTPTEIELLEANIK